jgi:hypothetical protein
MRPGFTADALDPSIVSLNTNKSSSSGRRRRDVIVSVCVFITAVPITKLFAWGEGDSGRMKLEIKGETCYLP